jgi:CubicO group peptidase (beta-lactamase class C family)
MSPRLVLGLAVFFLASCALASPPHTCQGVRESAINYKLQTITAPGDGALFAVLRRSSNGRVRPGDFDVYTYGNVSGSNSLRYGSITKIFTGYFGLTRGIELNDKPSQYGFSPADYPSSNTLRFRHVYSMESGIPEYATIENLLNDNQTDWRFGGNFTPALDVELGWKNKNLEFTPGSTYCYSNTNFELIGESVRVKTGSTIHQLIPSTFGSVAPSLGLDDGETPLGGWPDANGYNNWPYPYSMPGVSGTLRGKPKDLLVAYDRVIRDHQTFSLMKTWHNNVPKCSGPGATVVAGNSYGYALQRYDPIFEGPAIGHDGDLIVRSFLAFHPRSDSIFLFHYTNAMANSDLISNANALITLVLQDN